MIEGKVKALFSDKERTELLFPITKTSAITNDDGVGLDAIISDTVYSDTNAIKATAVPVNADTLGGKPAGEFATQNYVATEIAKAQLNGGDVDLSGFATKDDVSNAINGIDFPVDSVNGKTGAVSLGAEDVGAHPDTWLPTTSEIGAAPAGLVGGVGTYPTYENFMLNLKSIYTNMPDKTKRFLNMDIQASGDTSNGELGGGVWFIELNKVDNRYGYAVATSYSGAGKVRLHRQEIFGSEWKGWKDESRDAFAPAGYGLGGIARFINNGESLNAYTDTGFYHWSTGALDAPFGAGSLLVIKRSDTYVHQIAYQDDLTMPCMCIRKKINGAWQSWEWINPPMRAGVEYRTTERCGGSAVYAKRVSYNLGAIDASNTSIDTSIPHGISNFAYLVRSHCAKDSYVLPYLKDNGGFTSITSVDSANITLRAYKATWAEAIWFIDLYYVKY